MISRDELEDRIRERLAHSGIVRHLARDLTNGVKINATLFGGDVFDRFDLAEQVEAELRISFDSDVVWEWKTLGNVMESAWELWNE